MPTTVSSRPANQDATKRTPPARLFLGLMALAIITVLTLFSAMARGSIAGFVAVIANLALLLGLVLGHRWAYVLVILLSVAGIAVAFGRSATQGLLALIGDAIVLVPVLLSTPYFFPGQKKGDLAVTDCTSNPPIEVP